MNEKGQLHKVKVTRGNVDDRIPVPDLVKGLEGLLFADKGYIKAELFQYLYDKGLKAGHWNQEAYEKSYDALDWKDFTAQKTHHWNCL